MVKYTTNNGLNITCYIGDVTRTEAEGIVTGQGRDMKKPSKVTMSLCQLAGIEHDVLASLIADERGTDRLEWEDVYCFQPRRYGIQLTFKTICFAGVMHYDDSCFKFNWKFCMLKLYKEILDKASRLRLKSLAVPLLGSGQAGAPLKLAVEVLITALFNYKEGTLTNVFIVSCDGKVHSEIIKQWEEKFVKDAAPKKGFVQSVKKAVETIENKCIWNKNYRKSHNHDKHHVNQPQMKRATNFGNSVNDHRSEHNSRFVGRSGEQISLQKERFDQKTSTHSDAPRKSYHHSGKPFHHQPEAPRRNKQIGDGQEYYFPEAEYRPNSSSVGRHLGKQTSLETERPDQKASIQFDVPRKNDTFCQQPETPRRNTQIGDEQVYNITEAEARPHGRSNKDFKENTSTHTVSTGACNKTALRTDWQIFDEERDMPTSAQLDYYASSDVNTESGESWSRVEFSFDESFDKHKVNVASPKTSSDFEELGADDSDIASSSDTFSSLTLDNTSVIKTAVCTCSQHLFDEETVWNSKEFPKDEKHKPHKNIYPPTAQYVDEVADSMTVGLNERTDTRHSMYLITTQTPSHPVSMLNPETSTKQQSVESAEDSTNNCLHSPDESTKHISDLAEESTKLIFDSPEETTKHISVSPEESTKQIFDSPDESTKQISDSPDESTKQISDSSDESTKQISDSPDESTKQISNSPDESTKQISDSPDESTKHTKQISDSPDESTKHTSDSPDESTKHTKQNSDSPVESTKYTSDSTEVTTKQISNSPDESTEHTSDSPDEATKHTSDSPDESTKHTKQISDSPDESKKHTFDSPDESTKHTSDSPDESTKHTKQISDSPDESTKQISDSPDGSTEHTSDSPDESTEHTSDSPVEATKHTSDSPDESTKHTKQISDSPDESTKQISDSPDGSTEHTSDSPDESTEHTSDSPVEATKHTSDSPDESTKHTKQISDSPDESTKQISNSPDESTKQISDSPDESTKHTSDSPDESTKYTKQMSDSPVESTKYTSDSTEVTTKQISNSPDESTKQISNSPDESTKQISDSPDESTKHTSDSPDESTKHTKQNSDSPVESTKHTSDSPDESTKYTKQISDSPDESTKHTKQISDSPDESTKHTSDSPEDSTKHISDSPEDSTKLTSGYNSPIDQSKQQSSNSPGESNERLTSDSTGKTTYQQSTISMTTEPEACAICMDEITNPKCLSKCGHTFCTDCIDNCFNNFKPVCPTCNMVYGILTGDMPPGTMRDKIIPGMSCPGYEGHGAIVIDYHFEDGIQTDQHPNPGKWYHGTRRRGFLPNTNEGRSILRLLKIAFDRKLTFTVGRSTTTGREDMVTWNDIHHKTNTHGGPTRFGYPDPTYLSRVKDELASKGVTE